jgi:hypothetical protein
MEPTNATVSSNQATTNPSGNSGKNELVRSLSGVIPVAGFAFKLWVKIIKLSFKAAVWMVRRLPSPIKRVESKHANKNPTIIRNDVPAGPAM